MSKKLLSWDPVTKTKEWHYYDHSSKKTFIKTEQDCSAILEHNKAMQSLNGSSRFIKKPEYYRFARVPNTVLMDWKKKYNIDWSNKEDLPKIEKLLQSNEYKYLRTVDRI